MADTGSLRALWEVAGASTELAAAGIPSRNVATSDHGWFVTTSGRHPLANWFALYGDATEAAKLFQALTISLARFDVPAVGFVEAEIAQSVASQFEATRIVRDGTTPWMTIDANSFDGALQRGAPVARRATQSDDLGAARAVISRAFDMPRDVLDPFFTATLREFANPLHVVDID